MLYNRCNSLSMYGTVRGGQAPFPCNATQWLAPPLATRATATRARDPRPRPPRAIRDRERRQRPPLATRATATRARDQRLATRARNPLPVGMGRRGWRKGGPATRPATRPRGAPAPATRPGTHWRHAPATSDPPGTCPMQRAEDPRTRAAPATRQRPAPATRARGDDPPVSPRTRQ